MRSARLLRGVLAMGFLSSSAVAGTVFDNLNGVPAGASYSGTSLTTMYCVVFNCGADWATQFTTPPGSPVTFDGVDIPLDVNTSPPAGGPPFVGASLYSDAGGQPGTFLDGDTLPGTGSVPHVFHFPSHQHPVLAPNTAYWIVVRPDRYFQPPIDGINGIADWYDGQTGAARPLAHLVNGAWTVQNPRNLGIRVLTASALAPALPAAWIGMALIAFCAAGALANRRSRFARA